MNENLELGIIDAKFRIKRELDKFGNKIYLSFSGGKDSTVLAHLIRSVMADVEIPFVFANTGIELDATLDFVKSYDYKNVVITKPRKPAVKVWKDHGVPIKSKLKSEALDTYQRHINEPLSTARSRQLISGVREKDGIKSNQRTSYSLAKNDFHLLHPDLDYKIANKCCAYMKKYPFQDFAIENDMMATFTGVRVAEGGVRAITYKSCVDIKKLKGKDFLTSMPIIDWSDQMVDDYIKINDIKLSEAYTKYELSRTGCIACPFSQNLRRDLEVLYIHEPKKYKATMKMLGKVYIDSGVKCEWDTGYMQQYEERWKLNELRREEMLMVFEDEVAQRKFIK